MHAVLSAELRLQLHAQARLGLSPTQFVVLMHLADYWWHREQMPFPSKTALAERMGLMLREVGPARVFTYTCWLAGT